MQTLKTVSPGVIFLLVLILDWKLKVKVNKFEKDLIKFFQKPFIKKSAFNIYCLLIVSFYGN